MYPEFIPIYIGLGILFVMMVVILIMLIVILKKFSAGNTVSKKNYKNPATITSGNVAFCKNCATQFDAMERCCPKCGTPR